MNRTTVEEIKERLPIEEVIATYVKIEKSGKSYKARCPFHNEKTPSFYISPDRGGYYCFGCGAKGDVFSFVEQFEGLDFKGALKVLAERAGVTLTFDSKNEGEKDKFYRITEDVARYFEDNLKQSKEAKEYILNRGLKEETIKSFRIGWAPEGWQNLLDFLKKKGWQESFIEQAGFIKKSDKDYESTNYESTNATNATNRAARFYDRFRGRVMFPICDSSGRVVAFTGRILHDDGKSAKYLNSPETPIFVKSQILFGLDKAKSEIRRLNYSILVEGQMDLIMSHQAGIKNTVAASGTALTSDIINEQGIVSNLGLVRRLSPNMIIALDSDKAGKKATMRTVAIVALSLGMSVKVADSSSTGDGAKDPADLIKSDPEKWRTVLKNSKHVVDFETDNVLIDISDARRYGPALRERVFPFLARIDSEMDKAFYVKNISDKTHISEQAIWEDLRKFEKTLKPVVQNQTQSSSSGAQTNKVTTKTGTLESSVYEKESAKSNNRLDLVERRLFGLIELIRRHDKEKAGNYEKKVAEIAGISFSEKKEKAQAIKDDLLFEAEAFYGQDESRWDNHVKELLLNFEENLINSELIATMNELKKAESTGNKNMVAELAKKCQVLSIRKGQLIKSRI